MTSILTISGTHLKATMSFTTQGVTTLGAIMLSDAMANVVEPGPRLLEVVVVVEGPAWTNTQCWLQLITVKSDMDQAVAYHYYRGLCYKSFCSCNRVRVS